MGRGRPPTVFAGERYERWTVISAAGEDAAGKRLYLCRCDCGTERKVRTNSLTGGRSRSCGCLAREVRSAIAIRLARTRSTHGHARKGQETPTYRSWSAMTERCTRPAVNGYKYYGGRGVTVCERWSEFRNFLEDMGERPNGLTLDRIDPNGDYEPGNCRWADAVTQRHNRRTSL